MARISKKRFNLRLYIAGIILAALAIVGILAIVLYSNGWRYQTYDTSNNGKIKFLGKFEDNVPADGTIYYADGSTAKVLSGGSDKAASADTGMTVWKLKIQYANGDVYEGQTVHFLRHGIGKLTYGGGDIYQGEFHFDDMEGKGTYTYLSGDRYVGEFSKNLKHGKGTYTWVAGSDGTFDTYEGEYVTGKRCGKGIYTWADGTRYEGEFAEDAKDGKGKITFPDGASYEGDFIADTRTGKGVYLWANGDKYEGEFHKNAITGMGTYTWIENGERRDYTGYFENGKIVLIEENAPTTEEE